jgi:DnaK suppressor protein
VATKKTAKKAAPPARKTAAKPAAKKVASKPAPKPAAKKVAPAKKPQAKPVAKSPKPVAKPVAKKAAPIKKAAPVKKATPAAKVPVKAAPPKKTAAKTPAAAPQRKPAAVAKVPAKAPPAKAPVASRPIAQAVAPDAGKNERSSRSGSSGAAAGALKNGTSTAEKDAARSSPQVESMSRTTQKKSAAATTAAGTDGGAAAAPVQRPAGKVAVAVTANRGTGNNAPRARHVPEFKSDEATGRPIVPDGYKPGNDEEYMNPLQLEYFRQRLLNWRGDLVEESKQTIENLREEVRDVGDEAERATRETENSLELRTRDRYRKLIAKIEKALRRIEDGTYGFCEETDEEIGLERLDARPIATLSLDAQERREHLQKQMGD